MITLNLRWIVCALVVLCFSGCATAKKRSSDKRLASEMIGAWVHTGRPGNVTEAPEQGGRFKYRTGTHWVVISVSPESGLVSEIFGGTYTIEGDQYIELQQYADYQWRQDNGKSFTFRVKIEGDTMTQLGVGNPYNEVWKRVR